MSPDLTCLFPQTSSRVPWEGSDPWKRGGWGDWPKPVSRIRCRDLLMTLEPPLPPPLQAAHPRPPLKKVLQMD